MIEIKARWDGRVLYTAETATDVRQAVLEAVKAGADLSGADLRSAYLRSAYLSGADLSGADLRSADLRSAYLRSADLRSADLRSAYLSGARGINKHLTTPLYMLLDQPGKLRAYKLVTADGKSPIQTTGRLTYKVGETVHVDNASTDENVQCGAGINVASLDWCIKEWRDGYRILVVEFTAKDIAAIPVGSDGKFRVHRAKVVGEKDLTELGLVVGSEQ